MARHRSKDVVLYRQGAINFVVNREPNSPAAYFAAEHGPSACGMAFRVKDSHKAYARALELGAQPIEIATGPMELRLPAIKGIGGAPLYLIDRFEDGKSIYDIDFEGSLASARSQKARWRRASGTFFFTPDLSRKRSSCSLARSSDPAGLLTPATPHISSSTRNRRYGARRPRGRCARSAPDSR